MFDFAVRNGLVVDGGRERPFVATVYLKDGKIAGISSDDSKPSAESFDASGCVVAPGFVDIHSHSDAAFARCPTHESKLAGGVTFELVGQCGNSLIPVGEKNRSAIPMDMELAPDFTDFAGYVSAVKKNGVSLNLGGLVGHGTLRSCIAGWEMRRLTDGELDQAESLLDEQLRQGALGLSLGLIYPPGSFCGTDELVALARVVARRDKILAVHMRNENRGIFDAFEEMVEVAEETGVRLEISHLKLMGVDQWGQADRLLHRLELARARGMRVHCDQYPYTASNSGLTACLPRWVAEGGYPRLVERLEDPAAWQKIVADGLPEIVERGGPDRIVLRETRERFSEVEGMTLSEAAAALKLPLSETIRRVLVRCGGEVHCTYHSMDRGDMLKIMARTDIAIASDSSAYPLADDGHTKPHPRCVGTFARFLQTVREEKTMSPEDAVYKITALPATWMGLGDRIGRLKPGYAADITVFDFDAVLDNATYEEPLRRPSGIRHVLVNGRVAFDGEKVTGERAGVFYRG